MAYMDPYSWIWTRTDHMNGPQSWGPGHGDPDPGTRAQDPDLATRAQGRRGMEGRGGKEASEKSDRQLGSERHLAAFGGNRCLRECQSICFASLSQVKN